MEPDLTSGPRRKALVSLFLVSLYSIYFETFLTRYFAISIFSEYSYWIISIAMAGYSLSGMLLSLFREFFYKKRAFFLFVIPPFLILLSAAAFFILRINPFNPLKFQHEVLWKTQIVYIFLYYAGLFPVFFATGVFIGLNFVIYSRDIPRVYAMDLLGAAAGAVLVLVSMYFIHPYHLLAVALPILLAVSLLNAGDRFGKLTAPGSIGFVSLCAVLLGLSIYYVCTVSPLSTAVFKQLHAVLNVEGNRIVRSIVSPSGYYLVLDNYTELENVDMTNNYDFLKIGSPPRSLGVYLDGRRVSPLMKQVPRNLDYVEGSLSFFPYTARPSPRVLLVGTNGGFKVVEGVRNGAAGGIALEQNSVMHSLVDASLKSQDPGNGAANRIPLLKDSVFSYLRKTPDRFDIIEIAANFFALDDNNRFSFTREAVALYLGKLRPGGVLSIPVDISEFSVYAMKMMSNVVAGLRDTGVEDPAGHVMVYRSAWTCQILASNEPFTRSDIEHLKKFCWDRSFDTSYYPGIDPSSVTIWNDLPPVSFETATVAVTGSAQDAVMDDLLRVFSPGGDSFYASNYFDLTPSTLDKPDFFWISRLSKVATLFKKISILPQQEIGYLINLVVLVQALCIALFILIVPLVALKKKMKPAALSGTTLSRVILYFSALGLGFLFIELALIEKFSFFLENKTLSFGVVLSSMLVFSGFGSFSSARFGASPYRGLLNSLPVVFTGLVFVAVFLDPLMKMGIGMPDTLKVILTVFTVAPVSFALGRPFPLGNASLGKSAATLIPWAWAINGAFSVISTPLANILSNSLGWRIVIAAALLLYVTSIFTFPKTRIEKNETG